MLGCMGGVQGGGIISRSWESLRRCPGAAQLPHASSLVPTHLLGDRRGARAAVWAPPPMGNGSAPSTLCQQVPEWTKCTSREKRKEKVEKPFYSDSEGESGPTESADSGEDPVAWQGMGQGLLWWGMGRSHCGRDIRQVPPQRDTVGDTAVGTSHRGGNVAGGYGDGVEGTRDVGGVVGTQRDAVGGWGDVVGRSRELWGRGGDTAVGLSRAPRRA